MFFLGNGIQKIFRFCFCLCQTSWLGIHSKIPLTCLITHSNCWLTDHCPSPILSRICCYEEGDKALLQISKDNLVSVISSLLRRQKGVLRESIPSKPHEFCQWFLVWSREFRFTVIMLQNIVCKILGFSCMLLQSFSD